MTETLAAHRVTHRYGEKTVLQAVGLTASPGQVVGLIGPNGSGKTTLLRALYGAFTPDAGDILYRGRHIARIPAHQLAREVAVVVQDPPSDLLFSVADTVMLGRIPHLGTFRRQSARDADIASGALARVGALHLADREFVRLSGGEKQRVLIARALAQEPHCLLLDEPTNHLDINYQHQVMELVRTLGTTAVVVLHDMNLAARYCDSVVLLEHGRVRAAGPPEEVLRREVIEPVYRIGVQRVRADDQAAQLLFRPQASPEAARGPAEN